MKEVTYISDAGTLRYGSSDGGKTVKTDDPTLNDLMKQAAARMNLKVTCFSF